MEGIAIFQSGDCRDIELEVNDWCRRNPGAEITTANMIAADGRFIYTIVYRESLDGEYAEGYTQGKQDGYSRGYTDCDNDRAQEVIAAFERQRELAKEAKECSSVK